MKSSNNNDYYILLVDDEKDILDLFTEYLSSNGFNTISFQNPIKALNYFYQNQSNCSLVITDYKMPQMSGIDFIKKIRGKDTNCTRYKRFSKVIVSKPILLVKDGNISHESMLKARISRDEFDSYLRLSGTDDISDIKLSYL